MKKEQINAIKRDHTPESNQVASSMLFDNINGYKKKVQFVKLITDSGTGFICQTKMKNKIMKFLFTNNHVLDKSKIQNGSNIKIKDKDDIKILNNRFVCTNQQLDYSCIELFDNENFKDYLIIDPILIVIIPLKIIKMI